MTSKFIHLFLLIVICSLFLRIKCDLKNANSISQNRLKFYQLEPPLEWWRAVVNSGQTRNHKNGDKILENLALNKFKTKSDLNLKKNDKSIDSFPIDNQASEMDELEPVGATDFELINFWPGLNKRDTDYGHLR